MRIDQNIVIIYKAMPCVFLRMSSANYCLLFMLLNIGLLQIYLGSIAVLHKCRYLSSLRQLAVMVIFKETIIHTVLVSK